MVGSIYNSKTFNKYVDEAKGPKRTYIINWKKISISLGKELTHKPQAICIGTFGTNNAPETLLLQGTVRLVEVSLPITVHHAPLAVQHTETVTGDAEHRCQAVDTLYYSLAITWK